MTTSSSNPLPVEDEIARLGRTVIHEIPDAVIFADRDGVIRFWNAGAERIFGFSKKEAFNQSLDIIIPPRLRERHWDGYRHMMKTGHARHAPDELLSVPAQTKSGKAISIQFTVAPVADEQGKLTGIVAILRDVTATFQELKRLRAQAR